MDKSLIYTLIDTRQTEQSGASLTRVFKMKHHIVEEEEPDNKMNMAELSQIILSS